MLMVIQLLLWEKGFAIGSAVLTFNACTFVAYSQAANINVIDLLKPNVVSAMFIGGVLPYLFSGYSVSQQLGKKRHLKWLKR